MKCTYNYEINTIDSIYLRNGIQKGENTNFSYNYNYRRPGMIFYDSNSCECSFFIFINNHPKYDRIIWCVGGFNLRELKFFSFVNNSSPLGTSIIYSTHSANFLISFSLFVNNKNTLFSVESNSYLIILNCTIIHQNIIKSGTVSIFSSNILIQNTFYLQNLISSCPSINHSIKMKFLSKTNVLYFYFFLIMKE